ncbi:MAG: hypothetical protein PHH60_03015 [Candidatus Margulisbacteria bacterium]|nr:hypothetical protein [Candidatus Margulisiibacteriota bacterium]
MTIIVAGCQEQVSQTTTTTSLGGTTTTITIPAGLVTPSDLVYLGAFRLPDGGDDAHSWSWGGTGATYYPNGDPSGPVDGYPGSIYGIGHDQHCYVSEINIPAPVISAGKNLSALNTATALQPFTNVRAGVGSLEVFTEQARVDIEYLPAQGGQTSGKLYLCWGQHFQETGSEQETASHMWCDLDLTNSHGAWWVGHQSLYSVNDYLFEIPANWAATYASGKLLATGRYRDGGWSGMGPCLFAIAPWNYGNPPANNTVMAETPLLLYSNTRGGDTTSHKINNYQNSDTWSGGAWLTAGSKAAVIFVGTKGTGTTEAWYGFSNGVRYPIDDPPEIPVPPIPPYPHDDRGWWTSSFEAQIIFYNPADLAAVASGTKQPFEPQPYAAMNIDQYLFNINKVAGLETNLQKQRLGACCFDRTNGLLYVFEYRGDADNDRPLIHVWRLNP